MHPVDRIRWGVGVGAGGGDFCFYGRHTGWFEWSNGSTVGWKSVVVGGRVQWAQKERIFLAFILLFYYYSIQKLHPSTVASPLELGPRLGGRTGWRCLRIKKKRIMTQKKKQKSRPTDTHTHTHTDTPAISIDVGSQCVIDSSPIKLWFSLPFNGNERHGLAFRNLDSPS